jgi:DNA-binding SARP family transcriptional activator
MEQFEGLHTGQLPARRAERGVQTGTIPGRSLQEPPSIQPEIGPVQICLLGPFQALAYGEPLLVRGSKVEALLRLLALRHGDVVDREEILTQLWPDRDHVLAVQSLNSLVYGVQRLFREPLGGLAAILHDDGTYCLNRCAGLDIDVLHFDALISTGHRLARVDDLSGANLAFASAVGLYRGDLRVGSSIAEIIERERLRASYLTALAHLADFSFAQDEYADSLEYALRILAADPCREDAHRLVMRCRVRRGERAQALRQFRLCEDVLRVEFDAPPEPATRAVYDQIRLNPAGV